MELDALDFVVAMAETHDDAGAVFLGGPGADFEFGGQIFLLHDERVITRGGHGLRKSLKNCSIVVQDCAGLTVHEMRSAHNFPSESLANRLVSEADAKDRDLA